MINLAPLKYISCFEADGGPIHSLEESKMDIFGEQYAVCNACLNHRYHSSNRNSQIFSSIDGTGLDPHPIHARYKAISESIERWAFYEINKSDQKEQYGFTYDGSSNGMAAFPGLFSRQSRQYALLEAIERFSMVAWWKGLLKIKEISPADDLIRYYRISHPFKCHEVIISRIKCKRGCTVFGYGCGKSLKEAKKAATLEMERSRILLESFYKRNPGFEIGDLATVTDYTEKRLLYFSMPEGVNSFEEKVKETESVNSLLPKPKTIFDGELKGVWSKYATVWRIVYEMPSMDFLDPTKLIFLW